VRTIWNKITQYMTRMLGLFIAYHDTYIAQGKKWDLKINIIRFGRECGPLAKPTTE